MFHHHITTILQLTTKLQVATTKAKKSDFRLTWLLRLFSSTPLWESLPLKARILWGWIRRFFSSWAKSLSRLSSHPTGNQRKRERKLSLSSHRINQTRKAPAESSGTCFTARGALKVIGWARVVEAVGQASTRDNRRANCDTKYGLLSKLREA